MAKEFQGAIPKPIKKKKKSSHITNERITEYVECELCGKYPASSTHEVFHDGTSYARNLCITKGWQVLVCEQCHYKCHNDAKFDRKLKSKWQCKVMSEERIFDVDEWRSKYRLKSYI